MSRTAWIEDALLASGVTRHLHERGRLWSAPVLAFAVVFVMRTGRSGHAATRNLGRWVGVAILGQVLIGIVTVMNASPLDIALAHQAGALVVIAVLMRAKFEIAYPREQRIARG